MNCLKNSPTWYRRVRLHHCSERFDAYHMVKEECGIVTTTLLLGSLAYAKHQVDMMTDPVLSDADVAEAK